MHKLTLPFLAARRGLAPSPTRADDGAHAPVGRRFDIASAEVRPSPLPDPGRAVTSLARDGLGRVWPAGEGLRLVDPDGTRLHDCGALPMIGRTPVATIAADPGHRDGVIASLGGRGVVFVRVAPGS